jgi:predicted ribosomally synthesized peptide with nif11-like leader
MTEEKLNELLNDQAFRDEMNNAATLEDAAKIMQQHGIQITPEELQEIMTKMESESELNESELDDVAGGFWGTYAAVRAGAKLVYWLLKNPHFRQSLIL